jgi:hypothetical protein
MIEIWEKIPDAPDYEVSNLGRVASKKYGNRRILAQSKKKTGYYEVGLCYETNKRKWFLVHRLVLSTFNPIDGMENMEINHKDEDKSNNQLDNLEWVTSLENCNYGNRNNKISKKRSTKVICVETGIVYDSCKHASDLTGISRSGISNCLTGKRNRAGKYHWMEIRE